MSFLGLTPVTLLARLIVLLIGMPIHEWSHAWSAHRLGDDTAASQGRLSLNPLAHLDLFGGLMILLTGFGWARPVPVNPYRMRLAPRTGMALSAAAGPVSNFLVAALCAIPFRLGLLSLYDAFATDSLLNPALLLFWIADISLGLGLFNLLPFYPLDGEKVLMGVLPPAWADRFASFQPFSPFVLMTLLFLLPRLGLDLVGWLIEPLRGFLEIVFFTL